MPGDGTGVGALGPRDMLLLMAVVGWRRLAAVFVLGSLSCGGESSPSGEGGPEDCLLPDRLLDDGRCLAPGVQDNGCPAGSLGLEDGTCQPAGVPPALCAEGFEPYDLGCEPILPPEPCPPGLMAVPGDDVCREVAPCGQGRWGDIPTDGSTEHVDAAYTGGSNDGTADRPWVTIGEAVAAAAPGAVVAIAAGSYVENIDIAGKPVTLWGLCPAAVEVVGSAPTPAALAIRTGADGTQVRGLAIRGTTTGLVVSGSHNVALDRLWVHDNAARGINVQQTFGPTAVTISDSLFEQNYAIGVYVSGSEATIEGTVLRTTQPRLSDQTSGRGIAIQYSTATSERANVTLRRSLVEQNHDFGVYLWGSDATIEGTVVRTTLPRASTQTSGRGISIHPVPDMSQRSNLTLRASLVEQNHQSGVHVSGSDATIEGTVLRSSLPQALDQTGGRGINIQRAADTGERANATLRASLVEQNHVFGVFVGASDAIIEGTVVRTTLPQVSDQFFGRGIGIQLDASTANRANVTLRGSIVEQSHVFGVYVAGSDAVIEGTVVRSTLPRAFDGLYGDGLVVIADSAPASAALSSCLVESSARAGLAVFGAPAGLAASAIRCNAIDLNNESYQGAPGIFEDLGYNSCGCGSEEPVCQAVSAGLEAPVSVSPGG